jgi:hypothetical protein
VKVACTGLGARNNPRLPDYTSCLNGKLTVGFRFVIIANHYFPLSKALYQLEYIMDVLYKYSPIYNSEKLNEEYSIINLLNTQATFTTRKNFNDPFDSKIDFIKPSRIELKGQVKHEFKKFFLGLDSKDNVENFCQRVNKKLDEFLFFCLTSQADSNLMWSH